MKSRTLAPLSVRLRRCGHDPAAGHRQRRLLLSVRGSICFSGRVVLPAEELLSIKSAPEGVRTPDPLDALKQNIDLPYPQSAFRSHTHYRTGSGGAVGGGFSHGCSLSNRTLSRLSWKLMLPVRCS